MSQGTQDLPRWVDVGVVPLVNLFIALVASGVVIALVGQSPTEVLNALIKGALGTPRGLSYTLYYATTFVFTGLAVAVAFHAGLFNIGGEGQAMLGGLGASLLALWLAPTLPAWVVLPLMVLAAAAFAMLWALVPAFAGVFAGQRTETRWRNERAKRRVCRQRQDARCARGSKLAGHRVAFLAVEPERAAGHRRVGGRVFAAVENAHWLPAARQRCQPGRCGVRGYYAAAPSADCHGRVGSSGGPIL
jgi:hypothetical protein